eukprot:m51a1_g135 hypothetical protein (285) ;mRNA; f:446431-447402
MDAVSVAKALGIGDERVLARARELTRLAAVRARMGIGAAEQCKGAACLAIACREHSVQFDPAKACKLTGAPTALFGQALSTLQSLLDIRNEVSLRDLAKKFGCGARVVAEAERILGEYRDRAVEKLPVRQRAHAGEFFSRPSCYAAAFHIAAARAKTRVPQQQLADYACVAKAEFTQVLQAMHDEFSPKPEKRAKEESSSAADCAAPEAPAKRAKTQEGSEAQAEDKAMPDAQQLSSPSVAAADDGYSAWAGRVAAQEEAEQRPSKRMRQTTLSFSKPVAPAVH